MDVHALPAQTGPGGGVVTARRWFACAAVVLVAVASGAAGWALAEASRVPFGYWERDL
jgi:hypothetical protein